jgi:hypothetical protein
LEGGGRFVEEPPRVSRRVGTGRRVIEHEHDVARGRCERMLGVAQRGAAGVDRIVR